MKETYQLFVGTYSRPIRFGTGEILEGRGKGIHRYTFDAKTGTLYESTAPAPAENPSYLALSFDKQYLYAVNELKEYKNKAGGAVSVYRIESDGGLRFLNQRPTGGADPCYVGLDRERRCLTVANFTGGGACSYPLCADGSLEKRRDYPALRAWNRPCEAERFALMRRFWVSVCILPIHWTAMVKLFKSSKETGIITETTLNRDLMKRHICRD